MVGAAEVLGTRVKVLIKAKWRVPGKMQATKAHTLTTTSISMRIGA
jgi:hypothetical protein